MNKIRIFSENGLYSYYYVGEDGSLFPFCMTIDFNNIWTLQQIKQQENEKI